MYPRLKSALLSLLRRLLPPRHRSEPRIRVPPVSSRWPRVADQKDSQQVFTAIHSHRGSRHG